MKKSLKAIIAFSFLGFAVNNLSAQTTQTNFLSKVSLDAKYGMNMPLSPTENITASDYTGFNHFEVGATYHFDEEWGIRGSFASSTFKHKDFDNFGVNYSKISLEATYNVLTAIKKLKQPFDVTVHAGFGLGMGKSKSLSGSDMIAVGQIGIMPKYFINSDFAIFVDGTFVNQFSQDYSFNGLSNSKTSGSYLNLGLGVHYRFK